jgi:hypothetical protein
MKMENHNEIIENDTSTYPIKMYDVSYVGVLDIDTGMSIDDRLGSLNDVFEVSSKNKSIKRVKGRVGFVECVFENESFIVRPVTKDRIVFSESKTNLAETVNGYKASMFYTIGSRGLTFENTIGDEFINCIKYVGGFVDSFYFVKSEILNLTEMNFQLFINRLDYSQSKITHSLTNGVADTHSGLSTDGSSCECS